MIDSIDVKRVLRLAWIIESIWYFIIATIALFSRRDVMDALVNISPYLFGLIMAQGGAGWSGASLKRLTETLKEKVANGGGK